jgi:hypothetical protein
MKALNFANDPHGLRRLEKSRAKTPAGMMRLADKILREAMEGPLPHKPKAESLPVKGPKYAEQRCKTIDPNAYRAPFNRQRSPREMRNRRPAGWINCRFVLPKVTWEGLRALAINYAQDQQHSDWPGEHLKYPQTRNFYLVEALNQYFTMLNMREFCVQEGEPTPRRVRRFVAPAD